MAKCSQFKRAMPPEMGQFWLRLTSEVILKLYLSLSSQIVQTLNNFEPV